MLTDNRRVSAEPGEVVVLMLAYSFDTSAVSALRRLGKASPLHAQIGNALAKRNQSVLIPKLAIAELLNGGGTTPQDALSTMVGLVRSSGGRVVLGGSLHALWRQELWSGFAELGRSGVDVESTLNDWLLSVSSIASEVRVQFQDWSSRSEELQVQASAVQRRLMASGIDLSREDGAGLIHPPDEWVRMMVGQALAEVGENVAVGPILRNRLAYPSLLTLAALDAFNRQVLMIPTDYHSQFPRELRPLLRADPNHEVDALMASACAHSRQFVSNDITLNARLRFLAQRGFPVPQPITFTEFTDLVS